MPAIHCFTLQHAPRAAHTRIRGLLPALLRSAALLSAACEPSPGYVPAPPRVEPDVRIDEETELGAACPSPLDACGASITPSCRVSCQPAADGCANVWELYRTRLPDDYQGEWLGLEADGNHGLFTSYPIPDFECQYPRVCDDAEIDQRPTEYSIWRPDGVVPFSPAHTEELGLAIERVSDDGRTVLANFQGDPLYWTPETGVQPVPFSGASMARSGRLFAGLFTGGGVRWTPGSSVETLPIEDGLSARALTEGDAAWFMSPSRLITYSPAPGERRLIELPGEVPPDAYLGRAALAAADASFAIAMESLEELHLYRWSDGAFEAIELPAYAPGAWFRQLFISADGRVVVADIEHGEEEQRQLVRWSEQTGTQVLSGDESFVTTFVSSTGDLIYGRVEVEDGIGPAMRWTPDAGLEDLTLSSGALAFDGDVRVTTDDDGILVHKSGRAADLPLPVDHLRGRLVPRRPFWFYVQAASADARVLAGQGSDDPGNEWLWLARLQTVCPSALD